jgi:hypothetical protein
MSNLLQCNAFVQSREGPGRDMHQKGFCLLLDMNSDCRSAIHPLMNPTQHNALHVSSQYNSYQPYSRDQTVRSLSKKHCTFPAHLLPMHAFLTVPLFHLCHAAPSILSMQSTKCSQEESRPYARETVRPNAKVVPRGIKTEVWGIENRKRNKYSWISIRKISMLRRHGYVRSAM